MLQLICQIMANDSLRKVFRQDYPYERGLGIPADMVQEEAEEKVEHGPNFLEKFFDTMADFFEALIGYIVKVPVFVWVLLGVVLMALLFVWMYRSGFFGSYKTLKKQALTEADNIYEIDFQPELERALSLGDYSDALRLRYLLTLRFLADGGHVVWKLYKTPTQYAHEAAVSEFGEMTRFFLRVRYGKYPADEAMYRKVDALAQIVEKQKGGGHEA